MTEAEWLACADPVSMLRFLKGKANDRKLRLFACACCRRLWHLLVDERGRNGVGVAERLADGRATRDEVKEAEGHARRTMTSVPANAGYNATCAVVIALSHASYHGAFLQLAADTADIAGYAVEPTGGQGKSAEHAAQAVLLRDISGNPFHPMTADPSWLTSAAISLAQGIYADRAFDRFPILADALQDAGCDHPDILAHCRSDGPHVRGCWVVDLVLGRT
ncbi:MAG: hypothetical protein JWO38_6205 [Gemmataceae bacterium]|nr:hypothetical protein [Gemmataceae bacterium]